MKKHIYTLCLLSLAFIISCKKTAEPTQMSSDSLTLATSTEESVQAAPITIQDLNFDEIQGLMDLKSDTIYVTNYWASWCPPCIKEIPHFVELQEEYKDQKVKFTFVSIDELGEKEDAVIPFVAKYKMKNVYQMPPHQLPEIKGVDMKLTGRSIPVTVIQKKDKTASFEGMIEKESLLNKVEEFLKVQ